jgi:hypothetical protein
MEAVPPETGAEPMDWPPAMKFTEPAADAGVETVAVKVIGVEYVELVFELRRVVELAA